MKYKSVLKVVLIVALIAAAVGFLPGAAKCLGVVPLFGMALNNDPTKTTKTPVDIFIAVRTDEVTPVTVLSLAEARTGGSETWYCVGTLKESNPHWQATPFSGPDQAGRPYQTGVDSKHDIVGVETTYSQLQTLDGFRNTRLDVIAVEQGGTLGHRWQNVQLTHGVQGKFTAKEANESNLMIQRYGASVTAVYDQVTLE